MRREPGGTPGAAKNRVWFRKSLCTSVPRESGEAQAGLWELWPNTNPPEQPFRGTGELPPSHHPCSAPIPVNSPGVPAFPVSLPAGEPGALLQPFVALARSKQPRDLRASILQPRTPGKHPGAVRGDSPGRDAGMQGCGMRGCRMQGCSGREDAGAPRPHPAAVPRPQHCYTRLPALA